MDLFQTVAVGALVLILVTCLVRRSEALRRYCIPAAVVGGLVFSFCTLALHSADVLVITFDETLRDVFMRLSFCSVGFTASASMLRSGGRTVLVMTACKDNGNPEPEFSYMSSGFLVTLRPKGYTKSIDIQALELDDMDKKIIQAMIDDPSVRMKELCSITGLSDRAVRYRIDDLKQKGIVTREGSKKSGNWKVSLP